MSRGLGGTAAEVPEQLQVVPADLAYLDSSPVFLQTGWWARFKGQHGWSPLALRLSQPGRPDRPLSVLVRRLPLGLSFAYIPLPEVDVDSLPALSQALRPFLPAKTICVRWDLLSGTVGGLQTQGEEDMGGSADPLPPPLPRPFRKPPADVQPPDTVIVPLHDDETMMARMHKKTRYNIRLAEKKGVTVERAGVEALDEWYDLYRQTAERDRISIHAKRYYQDLFSFAPRLTLWVARYESQILAGAIVLLHGTTATYLYGASANEHRNLMAPYALQWAAMTDARAQGAAEYDLFGIPPNDDPSHPMHGLYRFKTGFGGDRHHRQGAWDWVYRPLDWALWTRVDALRIWYFKVWKKR